MRFDTIEVLLIEDSPSDALDEGGVQGREDPQ